MCQDQRVNKDDELGAPGCNPHPWTKQTEIHFQFRVILCVELIGGDAVTAQNKITIFWQQVVIKSNQKHQRGWGIKAKVCKVGSSRSPAALKSSSWKNSPAQTEMAEEWGKQVFAARRYHEDSTRGSVFVYTNSNNTRGTVAWLFSDFDRCDPP